MADVYCPRCFELVDPNVVFCATCGQFIYDNAPSDTREWDSRPLQIPSVSQAEIQEPVTISLPAAHMPGQLEDSLTTEESEIAEEK